MMGFKDYYIDEKMNSFQRRILALKQARNLKHNARKIAISKVRKDKKIMRGSLGTTQLLDMALQRVKQQRKNKMSKGIPWVSVADVVKNKFDKWSRGKKPLQLAKRMMPDLKAELELRKDRLQAQHGVEPDAPTVPECLSIIDDLILEQDEE